MKMCQRPYCAENCLRLITLDGVGVGRRTAISFSVCIPEVVDSGGARTKGIGLPFPNLILRLVPQIKHIPLVQKQTLSHFQPGNSI